MMDLNVKGKTILDGLWILFKDYILIALLVLGLYQVVVAPFVVKGASMEGTLHNEEIVLVDKMGLSKLIHNAPLAHGDVIVFHPPTNTDEYYIKRVLGLPGDIVRFTKTDVYVNNIKLDEPYANCSDTRPCSYSNVDGKSFTVPADHYFVMGDNRNNSSDSRSCFGAIGMASCTDEATTHFVPFENIAGKSFFVLWPLGNFAPVPTR